MLSNRVDLADNIKKLYHQFHDGILDQSDTISSDEVSFVDYSRYVAEIYGSIDEFDKYFKGFREPYLMFRTFDADDVVLDIGAHWGYSVVAMRHQGCLSKIISIEAMKANASALNKLAEVDPNYRWVNAAVGAESGELVFYIPQINGFAATGLSSTGGTLDDYFANHLASLSDTYPPVTAPQSSGFGRTLKKILNSQAATEPLHEVKLIVDRVRAVRIDDLLEDISVSRSSVAAVKLDIEGHESHALIGARELFTNAKPMLMIEEANRNPHATAVMMGYGYFHCEAHDGVLVPHLGYSMANDGFWIHPDKVDHYRTLGIFKGDVPSADEMKIMPASDGVERKTMTGKS